MDGVTPAAQGDKKRSRAVPARRFVYFIEAEGLGRVKIGVADNPRKRLAMLQVGCPVPLRLATVLRTDDAEDLERFLHQRFAARRVQGEWFTVDSTLREIMDEFAITMEDKVEIIRKPQPPGPVPSRVTYVEQERGESQRKFIARGMAEWEPGAKVIMQFRNAIYA